MRLFVWLQILWIFSSFWNFSSSQMGLTPLSPEEYAKLPVWTPEEEGVGEFYQIDWSPYLPSPGAQGSQNSCTAWAVAYAVKSYLETRDQEWNPDHPSRIFSPAFVYNQINGGRDYGSTIPKALELLIQKGCATLATMPYADNDFSKKPSAQAFAEATKYKCKSYGTLSDGTSVRLALRQGNLVIISVQTDPVFNSGMYEIFRPTERKRGLQSRSENAPHGYHAMVVVGYDDARQAFLLMNSWGNRWGKNGFCWVSYDLFKNVGHVGTNLIREAYVLTDLKQKQNTLVEGTLDKHISASGASVYVGFEGELHRHSSRVWLNGSEEAMLSIQRVIWTFPNTQGSTTNITCTNTAENFTLYLNCYGTDPIPVTGWVQFSDKSQKKVQHTLTFKKPAPQHRQIQLVQNDRYLGIQNNTPFWEWTLKLQGSVTDLVDVSQVTYHLHPSFPNPNRVVYGTSINGFAFTTTGWGTFSLKATVLFKDGSSLVLDKNLEFRDPIQNELGLANCAQMNGSKEGVYDWTVYVTGPLNVLRNITAVDYFLHPTFNPNQIRINEGMEYGFPLSRSGWGTFTITARVYFRDGSSLDLQHPLRFQGVPPSAEIGSDWR